MHKLSTIVKTALNKKIEVSINSKDYYLNEDLLDRAVSMLCGKNIAFKDLGNKLYTTKISSKEDFVNIVKNGAISIYEPVSFDTKYFTLWLDNNLSKKDGFKILSLSINRLKSELNASIKIVKKANSDIYGIKCYILDNENKNVNDIIAKLSFLDKYIDKKELIVGNLKKFCYSLNDNGCKEMEIDISEGDLE